MVQDYRVRFVGDMGNLAQFSASIRGAFSEVRNAYRQSASAPVASMGMPNLNTGGMTSQIDAYNRTLTQSGQVFHRYVVGFTRDLQMLSAAEKRLGAGGRAFAAPGGRSLEYPSGLASYGTSINKKGQVGVRMADLIPQTEDFFTGAYTTVIADLDKVQKAQEKLIPAQKEFLALQQRAILGEARIEAKQMNLLELRNSAWLRQLSINKEIEKIYKKGGIAPTATTPGKLLPTKKELDVIQNATREKSVLNRATGTRVLTTVPYFPSEESFQRALSRNERRPGGDPKVQQILRDVRGVTPLLAGFEEAVLEINQLQKQLNLSEKQAKAFAKKIALARKKLLARWGADIRGLEEALRSTPPIARDLDTLLAGSGAFRKEFGKQTGVNVPYTQAPAPLGAGASAQQKAAYDQALRQREAFSKALLAKGITPDSVKAVYDFEKGVFRLSGTMMHASGIQGEWSAVIDKNMKKVTQFTGGMRRSGTFLQQTARDFQKVVEWTIATTAVFGALGIAMGSFTKVNEINKDLTRFSITAKASGDETTAAFNSIAQIAYKTATPLKEMTSVMDDIALATRRATQTSEEWNVAMQSLAEAVGILTNLTGVDTVRATDLLSSAYKQLGILPEQLIPLLNKVTAVAGGNAQAIEDIISALGGVSEAAKAAGLTLDEQIASVQVLSQVTNKSAADVATSFKNLFGSLYSSGSEKILSQFGINIREQSGEVRRFLDIYKEIYDAQQSGAISAGRMQDVLRGISGGPRRAPDAAALLANMPMIYEQLGTSANASNEALMANARVLETNAAKLQQIRTEFDATLVREFTDAINKLVQVLYNLGSAINSIFPSGGGGAFGSVALQLLLMGGAFGALRKGMGMLNLGIGSNISSLIKLQRTQVGVISTTNRLAKAQKINMIGTPPIITSGGLPVVPGLKRTSGGGVGQTYIAGKNNAAARALIPPVASPINTPTPIRTSRLGIGGALAGGLAGGALLGGLGGGTGAALGQGLGLTLMMLGGPYGLAAGAALTAISTGFQLLNEQQQKHNEKANNLRLAVYDNIKALEAQRDELNDARTTQQDAIEVMNKYKDKTKLTKDETDSLKQAQKSYVDSTFQIIDANNQVNETMAKLNAQIPELAENYKLLGQAALEGNLNPKDLNTLRERMVKDILTSQGYYQKSELQFNASKRPEPFIYGSDFPNATPEQQKGIAAKSEEVIVKIQEQGTPVEAFDYIRKLIDNTKIEPLDFKEYFRTQGFEVDQSLISAIKLQLSMLPDEMRNTQEFADVIAVFGEWVARVSGPKGQLEQNIKANLANVQSSSYIGELTGDNAANSIQRATALTALLSVLKNLQEATKRSGPTKTEDQQTRPRVTAQQIQEWAFGPGGKGGFADKKNAEGIVAPMTIDEARQLFEFIRQASGAFSELKQGTEAYDAAAYTALKNVGVEVDALTQKVAGTVGAFDDLKNAIENTANSSQVGYYEQLLNLQAQLQGGEFKGKSDQYNAQKNQLNQLISGSNKLKESFQSLVDIGGPDLLAQLQQELSKIKSLEGIKLIDPEQMDQMIPFLLNAASTLGLTGNAVKKFIDKILALMASLAALDKLRAQPQIVVRTYIAPAVGGTGAGAAANAALNAMARAQTQQKSSIQGVINSLLKQINGILKGGSGSSWGSSSGGGGGGGGYNKPGILDLPEEFKQSDRSVASLLKEAIKNARSLQSQIPGETKANRKEIVAILDGTKKVMQTKGIGEEYLRRAMEELTEQIKRQNDLLSKADTIRRIRVGAGDWSAIANVPVNTTSGISVGGNGTANITLNLNGTVLTPAQFEQFANQIAAALKRQLAG